VKTQRIHTDDPGLAKVGSSIHRLSKDGVDVGQINFHGGWHPSHFVAIAGKPYTADDLREIVRRMAEFDRYSPKNGYRYGDFDGPDGPLD
jgi:hypothetical protein